MLKRKAYEELLNWKKRRNEQGLKEVLLINGARQVGKSFIVSQFGANEYESFINIDFIKRPELKEAFKGSKEPEQIYNQLSIYLPNMRLIPYKTLFFLDEIQNCGDARTALKFLACDLRFDFIASGSLLGLEYDEDDDENVEVPESIPVGYEEHLTMHSLDFEEFLWAKGYKKDQINYLKTFFDSGEKVPDGMNNLFESLFREYMVVGGMPEVVSVYTKTNNYNDVFRVQNKILKDYQSDISKHAKGEQKIKVKKCYDSIPKQLAKDFNRFQYSFVEKNQTSRKYGGSMKWLKDSQLINICYNVSEPHIPLMANEITTQFKAYFNDTGLLTQMYGRETKKAILNNTIKGNVKGAVYENVISELLVKKGYTLHYYKPNDDNELEFLIEKDEEVVPIEVKAGNTASISLNRFIDNFNPNKAFKLINGNVSISGKKISIPHYMILFI